MTQFYVWFLLRLLHGFLRLYEYIHTRLTALFPGLPGWAGTRKIKPIWILLKQETMSGSGISWAICKSAPRSRQITMPAPHHSDFYWPDALPAVQPTVSKHWRPCAYMSLRPKPDRSQFSRFYISRPFAQRNRVAFFSMWPKAGPKLPIPMSGIWTPRNRGSMYPHESAPVKQADDRFNRLCNSPTNLTVSL